MVSCLLGAAHWGERRVLESDASEDFDGEGTGTNLVLYPRMPEVGEFKYGKVSKDTQEEFMFCGKVPGERLWNMRRPRGKVVSMKSGEGLSSQRDPSIWCLYQPAMTDGIRARALAESQALIDGGVKSPTFRLYKKGQHFSVVSLVVGFFVGLPSAVMAAMTWTWSSYWSMLCVAWIFYAMYFLGSRAADIPPIRRVLAAGGALFSQVGELSKDSYYRMHRTKEAFDKAASWINDNLMDVDSDRLVTGYQLFLVAGGFLALAGLCVAFRSEIDDRLRRLCVHFWPPPPSPGFAPDTDPPVNSDFMLGPPTSPRTDVVRTLAARMEDLTQVVGDLKKQVATSGSSSSVGQHSPRAKKE